VPPSKTHCSDPHETLVMEGKGYLEDGAKPRLDLVDVHMSKTIVIEFDVKSHNFFILFLECYHVPITINSTCKSY
jgi:hypothetical protein